jgi:saccharopine dehydrogenase (NAD+, L-lysine-forming)
MRQVPEVFENICLASRNIEKCDKIACPAVKTHSNGRGGCGRRGSFGEADSRRKTGSGASCGTPLPGSSIMDACLETGVNYLDTANYEPPDEARFCYDWQWKYHDRFKQRDIMALLGSGFDPGVTNVFCAWARKMHFDEIHELDIIDCNAGDHGQPFATNFNPEINIREVTARGGITKKVNGLRPTLSVHKEFDFPEGIGPGKSISCTTKNWSP